MDTFFTPLPLSPFPHCAQRCCERVGGKGMESYILGQLDTGFTVSLDQEGRLRHIYIVGGTGSGKTALMKNLAMFDIENGGGCSVFDPHGDFVDDLANSIPKNRARDVIYFDPLGSHVISYNPLKQVPPLERGRLAEEIAATFRNIFADTWGQSRLQYIFTNTIRLLLDNPHTTLVDMPRLLSDKKFRMQLLKHCSDEHVNRFWLDEFDAMPDKLQKEAISPIQNKVGQFVTSPILRDVIGRPSTIDISRIMDERKIMLWNLSKAKMSPTASRIFGSALITGYEQAAQARATIPARNRVPHYLYIDEFQNFTNDSFNTILSESRKYALGLIVAHQYIHQIGDVLPAVLGNAGTTVVFRIGALDTKILSEHLGLPPHILPFMPNYHAWVKTLQDGSPTAYQVHTLPPPGATGSFDAVVRRSKAGYARPRG